jgi:hypothetical protein
MLVVRAQFAGYATEDRVEFKTTAELVVELNRREAAILVT